jgi:hypothetical protein
VVSPMMVDVTGCHTARKNMTQLMSVDMQQFSFNLWCDLHLPQILIQFNINVQLL